MTDASRMIPGRDPGACPKCGGWRKAGMVHTCKSGSPVLPLPRYTLTYEGPCQINCPEKCDVPEGATLALVPAPRHAWPDVVVCPNDGCGIAFLVMKGPDRD